MAHGGIEAESESELEYTYVNGGDDLDSELTAAPTRKIGENHRDNGHATTLS